MSLYQNKEYYLTWTSASNIKEINVGYTAVPKITSSVQTNLDTLKFFKIATVQNKTTWVYQENNWYPYGGVQGEIYQGSTLVDGDGAATFCINIVPENPENAVIITGLELWVKNPNSNLYNTAYNDGYNAGKNVGYNSGYTTGYEKAVKENNSLSGLILSVAEVPFGVIKSMFDFELLGVDIGNLVMSILTACLCIIVVRLLT